MEACYRILAVLGGLCMFLYGMRLMGEGLKSCSGGAMKAALARVMDNPVRGFILGMLVTCMIQSSTATIVLTVGLVGAGFFTFRQSVGIVLGANVGTAITAQVIRLMDLDAGNSILNLFSADHLASIALILGVVLIMFVSNRRSSAKNPGVIAVGFGILFMGLLYMSEAVSEMSDSLSQLLTAFEGNYALGFLSGVFVTGVIQSSSAVIGILQTLASSVGVRFCAVVAVIVGVNIGDCLTTFLVCRIGANPEQIRTVLVHVIYNVCAACLIGVLLVAGRCTGIIGDGIWYMSLNSGGVANIHGLFRLLPAVLLLPVSDRFAAIAERLVPDKPVEAEDADIRENLRELDDHLITNPGLALDQTAHLITHMADVALHNYDACIRQIYEFDAKREARIRQREDLLDEMADASNKYIVAISPYIALNSDNQNQNFQIRALTCFEHIGDLAVNIANSEKILLEKSESFSEAAMCELRIAADAVSNILFVTAEAYKNSDYEMARTVEPVEEVIDDLIETLKERHVKRMVRGTCDIQNGIQYQNILQSMERISDQCSDLAVYMLSRKDAAISGQEHQYIHNLHHSSNEEYQRLFRKNHEKYFSQLKTGN
ncbi:MAG: Na/Pi cotransporter family protein [Clostridiales bacterium]|nr:Na/Pi cotransporter family protein [Clostridiales bacterium]